MLFLEKKLLNLAFSMARFMLWLTFRISHHYMAKIPTCNNEKLGKQKRTESEYTKIFSFWFDLVYNFLVCQIRKLFFLKPKKRNAYDQTQQNQQLIFPIFDFLIITLASFDRSKVLRVGRQN